MIRGVVVDDESLIRSGFRPIPDAAEDTEVVASVPGGRAALRAQRAGLPAAGGAR
ncbi:hypothetical protein [Kitasatospora sp. NPDC089509]|uniref:hypothetical protein n=1 Tax=Kitasatospora sp. NPDC089509 TaxID=3364079 RepID=UPI003822289F